MLAPSAFLLIAGTARLWILAKRDSFPADMTRNWLYFVKMASITSLSTSSDQLGNRSVTSCGVQGQSIAKEQCIYLIGNLDSPIVYIDSKLGGACYGR